jgi:hypothetical protein
MEEQKKVIIAGIIFVLLIAAAVVIYYLFIYSKPKAPEEVTPLVQEQSVAEEKVQPEEDVEPLDVRLEESDELVRELARELSSHPKMAMWLMSDELIRKFVASVDNIANGQSPAPHIDFLKPDKKFTVLDEAGEYFIDPESYKRYDLVAEVFASLDSKGCVNLYKKLKLAIQEAYKDLGYPDAQFDDTLKKAMVVLLEVPVVEEDIQLEKKVVTYTMIDTDLESLNAAQKHLLRMGPDNVRVIQEKLREMAGLLGFME